MPKPLIGHCMVQIGVGKMFLFGGQTTKDTSNETHLELLYSWDAFIWHDKGKVSSEHASQRLKV